jgi:hypothetical protein
MRMVHISSSSLAYNKERCARLRAPHFMKSLRSITSLSICALPSSSKRPRSFSVRKRPLQPNARSSHVMGECFADMAHESNKMAKMAGYPMSSY